MKREIERIGVLTSGGDAPGMNACIRAVVRSGVYYRKEVVGIYRGYEGMIEGDFKRLRARDVGKIIHRGGTILKSARSETFRTPEGRKQAFENLQSEGIDGLVAIGGNGTFTGLHLLHEEFGMPVMGIPGTIDNDLYGTDFTIGFDTATNTVVQAVDQIRDTAASHGRLFFVEVMGRNSGFIAMHSGLSVGAEAMLVPERKMNTDELVRILDRNWKSTKSFSLVMVAEGGEQGHTFKLAEEVGRRLDYYDIKVTILGHLQRGGRPSCLDRLLSARLGVAAVEGLLEGKKDVMAGIVSDDIVYTPLVEAIKRGHHFADDLSRIAHILSI
ncbi:MAG: 6-phosphofructokinase [Bacteroidota bacterium]